MDFLKHLVLVLSLCGVSAMARAARGIEHTFHEGETLWFLAQVYYGDGSRYAEIMRANRLASSEGVQDGQRLRIPEPLFTPEQPGFETRLTHLRLKRAQELAKRLVASEKKTRTVVIPRARPAEEPLTTVEVSERPIQERAKAEPTGH